MFPSIFLSLWFGFLFAAMTSFGQTLALRTLAIWFSEDRKKIPFKWKKLFSGRSRCEWCLWKIEPLYLIPIFGFLFARGRCPHCQRSIPMSHFWLELLFFSYGSLAFLIKTPLVTLLLLCLILPALFVIWITDSRYFLIPDYPLFWLLLLAITHFFLRGDVFSQEKNLLLTTRAFFDLGVACLWFFLFHLIRLLSKKKLGFADATLVFGLSLFLGFPKSLFLPTLAALLGILSYYFLNLKKGKIPFAPYLISSMLLLLVLPNFIFFKILV